MLDTDTSSYIIKGGYGPVERRLLSVAPSHLCISAMTRAELIYGLKALPPRHRLHEAVSRFLQVVTLLTWDAQAADFHAEIKYQLKTAGTPIGDMDMMIAAHALSAHAVLVTNNIRHFKKIKLPLMLENWMA
ncbi:type II toxin-antitoxin system VapC family toxin [Granulicella rosea]|nr:type II toxin-antitoxin system VapC family toxin [Granulicella rosea]